MTHSEEMKQGLLMILVFFIWSVDILAFQQSAVSMIWSKKTGFRMVGMAGFEPTTFASRKRRATRLRYTPFLYFKEQSPRIQDV